MYGLGEIDLLNDWLLGALRSGAFDNDSSPLLSTTPPLHSLVAAEQQDCCV